MSFLDPPHLIYPHEAQTECGVRPGTVRIWIHRRKLHARGIDRHGRNLYDVADIRALAARSVADTESIHVP